MRLKKETHLKYLPQSFYATVKFNFNLQLNHFLYKKISIRRMYAKKDSKVYLHSKKVIFAFLSMYPILYMSKEKTNN